MHYGHDGNWSNCGAEMTNDFLVLVLPMVFTFGAMTALVVEGSIHTRSEDWPLCFLLASLAWPLAWLIFCFCHVMTAFEEMTAFEGAE